LTGGSDNGFSTYYDALTDFTMTVGPYTASDPTFYHNVANSVQVLNTPDRDSFIMAAPLDGPFIGGYNPIGFISIDKPFADWDLANVGDLGNVPGADTFWYLAFSYSGGDPRLSGTLTSISRAVPEPATLLLLGAGLAGVAAFRRRLKS
jgi:hypothetical protein